MKTNMIQKASQHKYIVFSIIKKIKKSVHTYSFRAKTKTKKNKKLYLQEDPFDNVARYDFGTTCLPVQESQCS